MELAHETREARPPSGWWFLAIGAGLAAATQALPALEILVGYFVVLVHELGHAAAGWLFGFPSIPAFDFSYGGGFTHQQEQSKLLVAVVLAALGGLAWLLRGNRLSLGAVTGVSALYVFALATGWHQIAILAMGHGSELLFASLFLYRCLSGSGCHTSAEQPLYGWIGFHIVLHDLSFAHGLATSLGDRLVYEDAKGGGHWMDFSRLAEDFFHVPLASVARLFWLLCWLPPIVAIAWHLQRERIAALGERLREVR